MANDKRFVVKNGLETSNINFGSPDKTKNITVNMLDTNVLSFSGDAIFTSVVGIGTTSPSPLSTLHLNRATGSASIRFTVADVTYGSLFASSSTVTLNAVPAMPLTFGTTNTERMRIDSAGNVGIGTNAPAVKLDVYGDGLIQRLRSITSTDSYLRFDGTGTTFPFIGLVGGLATFGNTDASPLVFKTNSVERLRISENGSIGIGGTNYGTSGQALVSSGPSTAPAWASILSQGTDIPTTAVDLNTYTTTGFYHQNANAGATAGTNYPAALAGMLEVLADGLMVYQRYTLHNSGIVYTRSYFNGTWYAWRQILDTGTLISGAQGGTGVNNTGRTITLGGNISTANSFTTSGNFATTLTTTAATNVTLPTSGTLAVVGTGLSQFANTTSAQLLSIMSDETGTGSLVFGTSPTFTTSIDSGTSFSAFGSSEVLTLGYSGAATSTTNISTGAVASSITKTINIGTGGAVGSITNINVGDADGGNTLINSQSLIVPGNIAVGANILATAGPILTLGTLSVGGTGYMNGTHLNQALTTVGTGLGMLATVVVAAGVVTSITKTWNGHRYITGDVLTVGSLSTTLALTAATGDGTTVTLTFAAQTVAPFEVGSQIIVAGVLTAGYNGNYTVTACTTTSVSYANVTVGTLTITGTVKMGVALTNSTILVSTVQGSDIYVSSAISTSIGSRIRLEYNGAAATGYEYGAITFSGRNTSQQGSGDLALIRGVAASSSGGSDIQFWTAENATAPNLSAVVTSTGNFRMYDTTGTFYSELSNVPTANRTITIPDLTGTVVLADTSGRLLLGTTTSRVIDNTSNALLQIEAVGTTTAQSTLSIIRDNVDAFGAGIYLAKAKSSVLGSVAAVVANDRLGFIAAAGADGTDINNPSSAIYFEVDGAVATGSVPGRITFNTTPLAGTAVMEQMQISANGNVGIGTSAPTQKLEVVGNIYLNNADQQGIIMNGGNAINRASLGIQIRTNNADAVRIDSTGRVGIGINLPTAKLHVVGTATITDELQAKIINSTNGIMVNSRTISGSYTITANNNAMSAGPIEIASGITVTVLDGARWVVM